MEQEKLLQFLHEQLSNTVNLAVDQGPIVFQEWIKYKLISSGMSGCIGLIAFFISLVILIKFYKKEKSPNSDFIGTFIFAFLTVCSVVVVVINLIEIIQLLVAPKAALLIYFMPGR